MAVIRGDLSVYAKKFAIHLKLGIISRNLFFHVALRPNAGHGLLILEVSRSHTTTHHGR